MAKRDTRGQSQGRPKRRDDPPPPRPKQDEPIPPEAAKGMGLPLNDDERRKRVEALRRSQERAEPQAASSPEVPPGEPGYQ